MANPNLHHSIESIDNNSPTGWESVEAMAKDRSFIKPATRQQVEMSEFVPPTQHGDNLGRHLVEVSIQLENKNLTYAEKERLKAEQTKWTHNTRDILRFISEDGFTKSPPGIDAFMLCEKNIAGNEQLLYD